MDEPLTALDPSRRDELMEYVARVPRAWNVPILYVTHSVEEALRLAPSMLLVRRGGLEAFGPTRDVLREGAVPHRLFPHPSTLSGDSHENRLSAQPAAVGGGSARGARA